MNSPKNLIVGVLVLVVLGYGVLYQGIWKWTICRKYVPIGKSMIITKKTGQPAGQDAYAGEGQMGVHEQLAGPGRHFFNPWTYATQLVNNTEIHPGEIGIVTNKVGKELPQGRFLAGPDEKGTQRSVLTPGVWRVNTHGQNVKVEKIEGRSIIKPGYVGVQTLREGDDKGIMDDVLQPGYYNINPRQKRVDIIEIGYKELTISTRFAKSGEPLPSTGVSFPLADGKEMYLDFSVVWGVFPKDAPRIIKDYGTIEMVESKIIVPQVLSICKNIGSNFTTMQFIEGDTRESFQNEVTVALQKMGAEKGMHILIALVRGFHPAKDIKETIQARMIAEEEKNTLLIEQVTDVVAAHLEQAQKVVDIAMKDFDAETSALVAGEREEGLKKAAEIRARADQKVAALNKQQAEVQATSLKIGGQASADVTEAKRKADATKLNLQIAAFGGPEAYNLFTFAEALPADLRIKYRYAGPGTLWTGDSNKLDEVSQKKLLEYLQKSDYPSSKMK